MLQIRSHQILALLTLVCIYTFVSLWIDTVTYPVWKESQPPCPDANVLENDMKSLQGANQTKKIDLLIIVLTASSNFRQRALIRQTWGTSCSKTSKVSCWFFTDKLESVDKKSKTALLMEQRKYKDIIFSSVGRGIQFGLRVLHLMQWGKENYDFRFILRLDDDIMLCLDHLLWDLPNIPSTNVHYGFLVCERKDFTFIDDATTMYSRDLIDKYLSQKPNDILCHPFGDAQVDIWEKALGLNESAVIHADNDRIHHSPPASSDKKLKSKKDFCDSYIALHGIFGNEMLQFWRRRGKGNFITKYSRKSSSHFCPYPVSLNNSWYNGLPMPPKPCYLMPTWNMKRYNHYPGREEVYYGKFRQPQWKGRLC